MPVKRGSKGAVYSMETRQRALDILVNEGLAEASSATNIPKGTISMWAKKKGIATSTPERLARVQQATAQTVMDTRKRAAESRQRTVLRLTAIAELAARVEIEMLQSGRASLSEVVSSRTRAIHDLLLIEGKATERMEMNVTTAEVITLQDELRKRMA